MPDSPATDLDAPASPIATPPMRMDARPDFTPVEFARAHSWMASVARMNGLKVPGARVSPRYQGVSITGNTVLVERHVPIDAMRRLLAEGYLLVNHIDPASQAGEYHRHHLLTAEARP